MTINTILAFAMPFVTFQACSDDETFGDDPIDWSDSTTFIDSQDDAAFLKSWCKDIGGLIKSENASPYDQVIVAAIYISSRLKYGSASGAFDALKKGQGTCVSGNALLAELLKNMGFKAKLRFAAKDKMSRYPSGIIFAREHHNVRVTIEGKTYYVDGTPGSMIVYLSDETKPVFYATSMFGDWTVMLDNIPGHETASEDAA